MDAGPFSIWLDRAEAVLHTGEGGVDVPCGECRGCCRSSLFIPVHAEETESLRHIPRALLLPAAGHWLMGHDKQGQCPMLVDNECSIYEHRPQACRDYDCRVLAATGLASDEIAQPEVVERAREWVFTYDSEESRRRHTALRDTADFLIENRELFPRGAVPSSPMELAALALRVYRVFADVVADESLTDREIVNVMVSKLA